MSDHVVASADEIGEGERALVQLKGREIGVFNVDGEYHAFANWCAHQSGPCCEGPITGTQGAEFDRDTLEYTLEWIKEGQILNCPWHGWEFDVTTGECLSRKGKSLASFPVRVEDGDVVVTL